ncbi:MAG: hypothetical protein P8P13_00015 [Flavobacteriaceae bacterium]|jgi:hypothetical protein|nr:hypothetical protein [Flavobacteriaceae bacterium]MDA7728081.1 hypothetical protein [Flavobacteriaceae bacterium]MDA7848898.1 hypothetical protein [Flavobacteriaceae bacterium]MDG1308859.1 hypothetical protein [Flavobacteriaceae bacterium]
MDIFEKIKKGIPKSIVIPAELKKLCEWTEKNGYPISGCFELRADDGKTKAMEYWCGVDMSDRFGLFGAGACGDIYAFWINDKGNQKIIHLGSEGNAVYILADNFIDFLRLLAIGYDEIGFADIDKTVEEWNIERAMGHFHFIGNKSISISQIIEKLGEEIKEGINKDFQIWVELEFGVKIPKRGNEITDFNNKEFDNWIEKQIKKYS